MKIGSARALLLAAAALVSCQKGNGAGTGDAGLHGPTDLVVTWTLIGQPATTYCKTAAGPGAQVLVTVSGALDPTFHPSQTADCTAGTLTLSQLPVELLGESPYVEGTLLSAKGDTVLDNASGMPAIVGAQVSPTLPTTKVALDFFAWLEMMGSSSSSTSSSTTSSSGTGGTGGMATSSSSGGTGGMATTSSSGSTSSGSTSSGTSTSSGMMDAGPG